VRAVVKCHDLTKKKMGSSVKALRRKFAGKAISVDAIVADLKAGKDDHPIPKASDADVKTIVSWMVK
jgi:cytochrome c551/c552